ncbi:hypothetical protein [Methanococcus aeolicus]|uniref:Uncharacterized protein n=1 Tax=Methanococcus aeolicus (strain ATCC BAA-1280 / DSM 17508 / OCM 812 / Nankai-3) TaxID=419665 RepID=A6UVY9_META3|nr:hypothetical protein [Methanococcus aeolicus]ABR56661.1 hypothetical protein Maeo_1084 [Methanococcus aeolicus Nankai-3]UXM84664.1 hypothetical protein N6C89_07980 [Methanococcus aeolicus]
MNDKNKNILLSASILINIILIIIIASSVYFVWSSINDPRNAISFEDMMGEQNIIQIVGYKIIFENNSDEGNNNNNNHNNAYIEVIGKNIGNISCNCVIYAKLYDSDGYVIGSIKEEFNNINSGETIKAKIKCPSNYVDSLSTVNLSVKCYKDTLFYNERGSHEVPVKIGYNILKHNNSQIIEIIGKNTNNKDIEGYVFIKYYDKNNTLIGQNMVYLYNIGPNETFKFKTNNNDWTYNNYTISKCTIFPVFMNDYPMTNHQRDIKIISQKLLRSKNGQPYVELIGKNTADNNMQIHIKTKFYNKNNTLIGYGVKNIENINNGEKFKVRIYYYDISSYSHYKYCNDEYAHNKNLSILGYFDEVYVHTCFNG